MAGAMLREATAADGGRYIIPQDEEQRHLGVGAFSEVLLATDGVTGERVALKRVFGPPTAARSAPGEVARDASGGAEREAECLRLCAHPCVVALRDAYAEPGSTTRVLVLELMATDLASVLRAAAPERVPLPTVRHVMRRVLAALAHTHAQGVMHRDVKPANVLVSAGGDVKLGDFGLARKCPLQGDGGALHLTHQVQSRWYRAPELLFASRSYSPALDTWSAGCILAELLRGEPLIAGTTDIDQLCRVVATLGSPSLVEWPVRGVARRGGAVRRGGR